jgi:hypothetical protein
MATVTTSSTTGAAAAPNLSWPAGIPAWQEQELTKLSAAGSLGTVPPQVLGAIDRFTSDYGDTGVGVNTTGYGGYFGEHANEAYPGGTLSTATLHTPSPAAFAQEATIAASALGSYGHTPAQDLNEYATGTPTKSSSFTSFVETSTTPPGATTTSFDPFAGITWLWTWGHGHVTPSTGSTSLVPGSGVLSSLGTSWGKAAAELLVVGLGGVLVLFGLYKAAGSPGRGATAKAAQLAPVVAAA